jgi:hypothetical protein
MTDYNDLIQDLLDDFYTYMLNNNKAKDEDGYYSSGIHCSQLGMCKRKVVMDYYKFDKKQHELPTLLQFEGGNHFHDIVQTWIRNSKRFKLLHENFNVTEGLPKPVTGKLDVVFQDTITDTVILADVKTAMPRQFEIQKYKDSLPKENHRIQVTSYGSGLSNLNIHYDELAVMYFDRAGSNKPLIYFVEPYPDIEALMNDYILAVLLYKHEKTLPPRLDDILDKDHAWECGYCDFNNISCEGLLKGANNAI